MYYNILTQKDHPKYRADEKMQWLMSEVKTMYQQYAEQTKQIFKEYGNQ